MAGNSDNGRLMRVSGWSLRARLVLAMAALAALALGVLGVVAVLLLRGYLTNQVDSQLSTVLTTLRQASALNGQVPPAGPAPVGSAPLPTPFVFTQLDGTGRVLQRQGGAVAGGGPVPDLTGIVTEAVTAPEGAVFTVGSTPAGSSFRVRLFVDSRGHINTIAESLQPVDATVRRLVTVTVVIAVVLLLLVAGAGIAAVRVGLRPLDRIERVAEDIAAGDLGRRVPAASSDTEVGRLAVALNGMLTQIQNAFQARRDSEESLRQFVADASHELRTPVTTIRGYAELDRAGALTTEAARRQAMGRIESEAVRMSRLVEDLLLLADLDQHRPVTLATVDLVALVSDVVADARVRDPSRPISQQNSAPGAVFAVVGEDGIRQIVSNLVSNALNHTPPGMPVSVTVTATEREARIEVTDAGPGISPEHQRRIFERFYRIDASRARDDAAAAGGSGLGLAIVAAIVAAHHGKVECLSTEGGTTIAVTVPRTAATNATLTAASTNTIA